MEKIRFFEIDFFRGLAVIMMIIYHFIFDLNYFEFIKVNMYSGFLGIFQKVIAISFIFLVGISLSISYKNKSKKDITKSGLKIFSFGLILTVLTLIFVRNQVIYFGILHFIGLSIIISILFIRFFKLNLILGIISIIIGYLIKNISINTNLLIFLGLKSRNFSTLDYFPLFPWFGLILIGIFIGKLIYKNRTKSVINEPKIKLFKFLEFLGRKSLFIYLIHQPILILILYLIRIIK